MIHIIFFLLIFTLADAADVASDAGARSFTYNGFHPLNLTLDGSAQITPNGALQLTNTTAQQKGHAFHPHPIAFKDSSNASASSFSTTFVFSIDPQSYLGGDGLAFTIAPSPAFPSALPAQFLGLFNARNATTHIVAVEIDTLFNSEFSDLNDNHIGIDVDGPRSVASASAGFLDGSKFKNLSLISRKSMQMWIDYDGAGKRLNVSMAPLNRKAPVTPLISVELDLSPNLGESMYVGFSASTGSFPATFSVAGWSFAADGQAQPLSPKLPRISPKKKSKFLKIFLPIILSSFCGISCECKRDSNGHLRLTGWRLCCCFYSST